MTDFSPREIVSELDRHIIGQKDAKRAVAVALRNRWRRQQLEGALREEVMPKNILMIGPTGVGKTEISRRLAKLAGAPFIKIEATKFTEVGYVGRDVEQIIRDLVEIGIGLVREKKREAVRAKAHQGAEDRVLDALVGKNASPATRESFAKRLRSGELDDKEIEVEVADTASPFGGMDIPGMPGGNVGMINLSEMFGKAMGGRTKTRRTTVKESYELLIGEESDKLLDTEALVADAIAAVENNGIVFLDEIDKVANNGDGRGGAGVSREGVQPDLLPELQGRLPIRVELQALTKEDFRRILTETEASLIKQYIALMKTENVDLEITEDAIDALADLAVQLNGSVENIGARRLQTVMERVLDDISFDAPDKSGQSYRVDGDYVHKALDGIAGNTDLSRFIL